MFDEIKRSVIGKAWLRFASQEGMLALKPDNFKVAQDILYPEPSFPAFTDPDQLAALKLAQISVVSNYAYSTWLELCEAFGTCESPIERYFLSAFVALTIDASDSLVIHTAKWKLDTSSPWLSKFHVYPQHAIGDYRVDFLLVFEDAKRAEKEDGTKAREPTFQSYPLVVECDGHDFHEKTKEQASRDKERDRVLQSCGYPVFRFSGSDIHGNALKCAYDCVKYLQQQAWGKDWMEK